MPVLSVPKGCVGFGLEQQVMPEFTRFMLVSDCGAVLSQAPSPQNESLYFGGGLSCLLLR